VKSMYRKEEGGTGATGYFSGTNTNFIGPKTKVEMGGKSTYCGRTIGSDRMPTMPWPFGKKKRKHQRTGKAHPQVTEGKKET